MADDAIDKIRPRFEKEHRRRSREMSEIKAAIEKLRVRDMELTAGITEMATSMSRMTSQAEVMGMQVSTLQKQVEEMEGSLKSIGTSIEDLEVEVTSGKAKLAELELERQLTQKRVDDPSLVDVLEASSNQWNPVSREIYKKAVKEVIPAVDTLRSTASAYQQQVTKMSRFVALAVSLLVYGFVFAFLSGVVMVFRKVRGRFTLPRMLFIGDLFSTLFWAIMLVLYALLWTDPMLVIQNRMPAVFFVFQLSVLVSYVVYVYLRVIMFAEDLSWSTLGELLSVIVVGHHYYLRVWQPAMSEAGYVQRTVWVYYVCYMWMFGAFMYNRVQTFAPLQQLRGKKLSMLQWLLILRNRFWTDSSPDGEIETASLYSSDTD
uniref:Uncharacterized protein n=1 Tax=Erythrolobus australicus TaxID=1077150 RepID=A0A7S1XHL5_9RHOD